MSPLHATVYSTDWSAKDQIFQFRLTVATYWDVLDAAITSYTLDFEIKWISPCEGATIYHTGQTERIVLSKINPATETRTASGTDEYPPFDALTCVSAAELWYGAADYTAAAATLGPLFTLTYDQPTRTMTISALPGAA